MADNRMYLRCKVCGETFFLGKRLGSGYYIGQNSQHKGIPLRDRLNNFYYDHEECGYLGDYGLDCFELVYETQPEPEELPRWIPVTERLPEIDCKCLCVFTDGTVGEAHFFASTGTFYDPVEEYDIYDATHWRPLPDPPKEDA